MSNQKFRKPRSAAEALAILGLPINQQPSVEVICKAYRALAKKYHPDANPDGKEEALVKFLEASYAYEILTNSEFRTKEEQNDNRDLHIVANVVIRFEDGFFGKAMRLCVNFTDPLYKTESVASDGVLVNASTTLMPIILEIQPGTVQAEFRFMGKGLTKDGMAGDLTINIKSQPHPVYSMDHERNVHSEVQVPLEMMLEGGEMEVQTMYGIKKLVVPAGTQPKDRIRLKGLGPGKLGHHFVSVNPEFPSKDKLMNSATWKKLDIHWDLKPEEVDEELESFRNLFSSSYRNF